VEADKPVCLGKVLRPFGVKGIIKIESYASPQRFLALKDISINGQTYRIEKASLRESFVYLKLFGIEDLTASGTLRNSLIYSLDLERPELDEGSFYVDDLKKCIVWTTAGQLVGKLIDVLSFPANDVFLLEDESGKEVLIPALKEVVKKIDLQVKEIIVEEWGIVK